MSLAIKSKYKGIYLKHTKRGKAFIARYTIDGKTKTQIIGYLEDGMTEYDAYKSKLQIISSIQLAQAIELDKNAGLQYPKLFKQFMDYREPILAKNTRDNYRSIFNQYINVDFKHKDIRDVTYNDLQNYINKLLTYRRPATVDKIVSAFKKFYRYLQDEGIYQFNPASKLLMPKYDNKKHFTITKRELNRIITYIKNIDSQIYKTFYYLLFTGRRVGELSTLAWKNVNLQSKIYYLDYDKTKTKKNQYFYLEDFHIVELKKLREMYPESKYVFENPKTKKPFTYTSYFRQNKQLRLDLNMPDYSIHMIRHTVATTIINNGYSLEIVAKLLAHSDIKTSSRYAVLEMNKAKKAYSKTFLPYFLDKN